MLRRRRRVASSPRRRRVASSPRCAAPRPHRDDPPRAGVATTSLPQDAREGADPPPNEMEGILSDLMQQVAEGLDDGESQVTDGEAIAQSRAAKVGPRGSSRWP